MAVKTIEYKEHAFSISYEIVNPDKEVDAVFLHGWGADKETPGKQASWNGKTQM